MVIVVFRFKSNLFLVKDSVKVDRNMPFPWKFVNELKLTENVQSNL